MATREVSWRVKHVAMTTAEWAEEVSVIARGVLCVEFATVDNVSVVKMKVGDGLHAFDGLPYASGDMLAGNYYTKVQTDTLIASAIEALGNVIIIKGVCASVDDLPSSGNHIGDLYFVANSDPESKEGSSSEYVWMIPQGETNPHWEFIGTISSHIDLSGYATITYVDGEVDSIEKTVTNINQTITNIVNGEDLSVVNLSTLEAKYNAVEGMVQQTNARVSALEIFKAQAESKHISVDDTVTINCTL